MSTTCYPWRRTFVWLFPRSSWFKVQGGVNIDNGCSQIKSALSLGMDCEYNLLPMAGRHLFNFSMDWLIYISRRRENGQWRQSGDISPLFGNWLWVQAVTHDGQTFVLSFFHGLADSDSKAASAGTVEAVKWNLHLWKSLELIESSRCYSVQSLDTCHLTFVVFHTRWLLQFSRRREQTVKAVR